MHRGAQQSTAKHSNDCLNWSGHSINHSLPDVSICTSFILRNLIRFLCTVRLRWCIVKNYYATNSHITFSYNAGRGCRVLVFGWWWVGCGERELSARFWPSTAGIKPHFTLTNNSNLFLIDCSPGGHSADTTFAVINIILSIWPLNPMTKPSGRRVTTSDRERNKLGLSCAKLRLSYASQSAH